MVGRGHVVHFVKESFMKLNVIITGATGMVGEGVLKESIDNPAIGKILLISRKPSGVSSSKIEEIIHADFTDISPIASRLQGYHACYFCLGISSLGVNAKKYYAVTYTLTMSFAQSLSGINPDITFCYVSGAGTDSSEKGNLRWARVKGKTENDLIKLSFKAVYNFRPGFLKPFKGAQNAKEFYSILNPFFPFFRRILPHYFLTLQELGKAMIRVTQNGYDKKVLETRDIARLSRLPNR